MPVAHHYAGKELGELWSLYFIVVLSEVPFICMIAPAYNMLSVGEKKDRISFIDAKYCFASLTV